METAKKPVNPLTVVLILSGAFFIIFLIVSAVLFMTAGRGGGKGGAIFGGGSVAVVDIAGVILDSKKVLRKLEKYEEDTSVKAVVVRLNSPGGAVAPSQEIYQAVRRYKKPIVASMASVAASGAYYIAAGAKKVYANPGTITGSIGVIMEFANLQRLYDWAKIQRFAIKTGKYKDSGAEYREMTGEEKALMQAMVDDVLVQFKKAVVEGRKLTMEKVTAIADGRIMSGVQAKAHKLVDEVGSLQDAIDEAAKMANIKGKPKVVYADKSKRKWWMSLFDDASGDDDGYGGGSRGLLSRVIGGAFGTHSGGALALEPGIYWLWSGAR
ncbi:MAG: hypothetical protein A2583_05280 [Bdellovibrionales bacterium RIFOXYD1_FULL_53_11]|nr:MAG: hypothetical protein A2583_05280 [Bdellovibrionales bacterium RIFOXYD1_FULL_53_11]